mmetsp:Transcript_29215/g.57399  ORF Transcript_29215/g.57399 Transcript_29215/m.57399 type:complete len:256 (-) Transcript_29215:64-831(-)
MEDNNYEIAKGAADWNVGTAEGGADHKDNESGCGGSSLLSSPTTPSAAAALGMQLAGLLKVWAYRRGVLNSKKSLLNSYGLCLMFLYYWQQHSQPEQHRARHRLSARHLHQQHPLHGAGVVQHLYGFFTFYSCSFDPSEMAVQLDTPQNTGSSSDSFKANNLQAAAVSPAALRIVDPLDFNDNPARTITEASWRRLVAEFHRARLVLQSLLADVDDGEQARERAATAVEELFADVDRFLSVGAPAQFYHIQNIFF